MLSEAVLDAMLAAGCTREQIVATMKADLSTQREAEKGLQAERRERERMRKRDQRHRKSIDKSTVASAVSLGHHGTTPSPEVPSPDKDVPHTPLENNLFPLPPTTPSEPPEEGVSVPGDPVPGAFDDWNKMAGHVGLAVARDLTPSRRVTIRARLRDCDGDREAWREVLRIVARTPFLLGENDRGWRADLDWLLKAGNFTRVRERAFDRGGGGSPRLTRAEALQEDLRRRILDEQANQNPAGNLNLEADERFPRLAFDRHGRRD